MKKQLFIFITLMGLVCIHTPNLYASESVKSFEELRREETLKGIAQMKERLSKEYRQKLKNRKDRHAGSAMAVGLGVMLFISMFIVSDISKGRF